MNTFRIGELVELKSGGPKMVIADIKEVDRQLEYLCLWFNDKTIEAAVFHTEVLDYPKVDIMTEYFI